MAHRSAVVVVVKLVISGHCVGHSWAIPEIVTTSCIAYSDVNTAANTFAMIAVLPHLLKEEVLQCVLGLLG